MLSGCKDKEKVAEERVISVNAMVADTETFGEKRTYVGTIEASEAITLSFEAGGNVKDVFVKVGDNVHAGQLLARLDKTSVQSSYDAAKSTLKQAEDGYRRKPSRSALGRNPNQACSGSVDGKNIERSSPTLRPLLTSIGRYR